MSFARGTCAWLLVLLLAATPYAWSNPSGPQVAYGQALFQQQDAATLQVINSPGAIINWQSFGIDVGEATRFVQQSAASAVLNRVTGVAPSQLLGELTSNGRVYVINPNGIVVGENAVIDTAGFIASTLNLSDEDFKRGKWHFSSDESAGAIENRGFIRVADGGDVLLVAPSISNQGVISSAGGDLTLAAGGKITITSIDDPAVQFDVEAPTGHVLNLGEMVTRGGAVTVFANSIQNLGHISADGITIDESGRVHLIASAELELGAEASVRADGVRGGEVHIESRGADAVVRGAVSARGHGGPGGEVRVSGERVGIFGAAEIDVSGTAGGGKVRVGGDFQGQNTALRNARHTVVDPAAQINASAVESGDGGDVVVWSDGDTYFSGAVDVSAGSISGDGGFVEVSAKQQLSYRGTIDTSAAHGSAGTVLFDPKNIVIQSGGTGDVTTESAFSQLPTGTITFDPSNIVTLLDAGTDVVLQAHNDISVLDSIDTVATSGPGGNLSLQAGRSVMLAASVAVDLDFGSILVVANEQPSMGVNLAQRDPGAGSISMADSAAFTTGTGFGTITLRVENGVNVGGIDLALGASITTFEAAVSLKTAPGGTIDLLQAATINTAGGNVDLVADTIHLRDDGVQQVDASSNAGFTAEVTFAPATPGGSIGIVATSIGSSGALLELETGDLQLINVNGFSDGFLHIGDPTTGDITIVSPFAPAAGGHNKDRVNFTTAGDLQLNAAFDGTGLSGVDSGNALEITTDGDLFISGPLLIATGGVDLKFGQGGGGGTLAIGEHTTTTPAMITATGSGSGTEILASTFDDQVTLTAANTGTFANGNMSQGVVFSAVGLVAADAGDDVITILDGVSFPGRIDGGLGVDELDFANFSTPVPVSVVGLGINDGFDIQSPTGGIATNFETVTGRSAGGDQLTGPNLDTVWTRGASSIDLSSGGRTLNGIDFENAVGGSGNDRFIPVGTPFDFVDGGAGNDEVQYSGGASVTVNLATQSATDINAFTGIELFNGGSGLGNVIRGANVANIWNVTGVLAGDVNGVSFTNFETLVGGSAADDFLFANGGLVMSISGGLGANQADFSAFTSGLTITQTGSDAFSTGPVNNASNVGAITGTPADDTFIISGGSTDVFTGVLDGSAGFDAFDGSASFVAVTLDLDAGSMTNTGGVQNFEFYLGNAAFSNVLRGPNSSTLWQVNGIDTGNVGGVQFSAFDTLVGSSADDWFSFLSSGTVTSVDGGAGPNTLDFGTQSAGLTFTQTGATSFSSPTNAVNVDSIKGTMGDDVFAMSSVLGMIAVEGNAGNDVLSYVSVPDPVVVDLSLNVTSGTSAFTGIETFVANAANSNQVVGRNTSAVWQIDGANTFQAVGLRFIDFDSVTGGSLDDRFVFQNGASLAVIDGGGSVANNIADFSATTTAHAFTQTGSDRFTVDGAMSFMNTGNIIGGTADDTFTMASDPNATVAGFIDGGGGNDQLDFAPRGEALTADPATGTATDVLGGYVNIETLQGTAFGDTFTITNPVGISVAGLAGDDIFRFAGGGGSLSGASVDGGAGIDQAIFESGSYALDGAGLLFENVIVNGASVDVPNAIAFASVVLNNGAITIPGALTFNGYSQNAGVTNLLASGVMTATGPPAVNTGVAINGGQFAGAGQVVGDFVIQDAVLHLPGISLLDVTGAVTLGAGSVLQVEYAPNPSTPGLMFDQLQAGGDVSVVPGAVASLIDISGHALSAGDVFAGVVVAGGTFSGQFIDANTPPQGLNINSLYTVGPPGDFSWSVVGATQALPSPSIPSEASEAIDEPIINEIITLDNNGEALQSQLDGDAADGGADDPAAEDEQPKAQMCSA